MQESELEGELLFHAPPSGPTVKFAFSDSEFVAGDLEIMINGVTVRVFVNTQDTRNWGRASEERGSRVFAPSPIHNTAISRIFDTVILCLAPLNPRSLSLSCARGSNSQEILKNLSTMPPADLKMHTTSYHVF